MKANMKGLGGIKGLVLTHGDKVVVAAVGIVSAMMVMKSLGRESLPDDLQPGPLNTLVQEVSQKVSQSSWSDAQEGDVKIAAPLANQLASAVPAQLYRTSKEGWNPSVVPPTVMRSDPTLLAAADVFARGGSGLLAFIDEDVRKQRQMEELKKQEKKQQELAKQRERDQRGGGRGGAGGYLGGGYGGGYGGPAGGDGGFGADPENPNRRPANNMGARRGGFVPQGDEKIEKSYWASVMALVPVKEQMARYRDALENAKFYNAANDFPRYRGYFVERAEYRSDDTH